MAKDLPRFNGLKELKEFFRAVSELFNPIIDNDDIGQRTALQAAGIVPDPRVISLERMFDTDGAHRPPLSRKFKGSNPNTTIRDPKAGRPDELREEELEKQNKIKE